MRNVFILLALVFSVMTANAKPISREQAQKRAAAFMAEQRDFRMLAPVTNSQKLSPRKSARQGSATEPYYVFDKGAGEGFVIVSGDDQTIGVLGYCDEGSFDYEQLPPGLQDLLDDYDRQITRIQAGAPVLKAPAVHPKVEQLMSCKWSQGSPYNNACPLDEGRRSVTGCVATAMAQILYYNREKMVTETQAAIPAYTTWTKQLQVPGIAAGAPIDWDNMKDTYGSSTDLQKQAVANLMLYCGVSVKMDYTNSQSGAQSEDVYHALLNYFGFGSSVKFVTYADVSSDDDWDRIVYAEMAAGRPVYVSGSNASAGHAFVAHGYENQRYYINWGWGGQSDGLYYLTNLTPGDGQGIGGSDDGYNSWKQIVVGIEPENFLEKKMTISDVAARKICVDRWDADGDGILTYGEAAAITDLGDAFKGNADVRNFKELYYFTSLSSLADDAFNGCTNLTSLRLPKALKKVGARAFKGCEQLRQVNLPTSVDAIGEEAFSGCKLLSAFEFPEEVTAIEDGTFKDCAVITSIELPIVISKIGSEAFAGCSRLSTFKLNTFHPADIQMGTKVFEGTDMQNASLYVMQGTKAYFAGADQWKDFGKIVEMRELSGGVFASLEAGKTYYLYNMGTGRYLTKGEAYKTQAVVDAEPMRFVANHSGTMADGIYYFTSPDTGNDGKYLFRTTTDGNVGKGVKAVFVDGKSLSATSAYWEVKEVSDKVYTIQVPSGNTAFKEGECLGVQTDHRSDAASPTYGAYYDVVYATHEKGCQWQFVLYDEEFTAKYSAAETLSRLLSAAKKRNLKYAEEQAVYDNLDSPLDTLLSAQSSLRKKLGYIEFCHDEVRQKCIDYFDSDTDGELSYKEASEVKDFGWLFNFMNMTSIVHCDELQYFTNASAIHGNFMQGCTNLETAVLPKGLQYIYYHAFYGCKKLQEINIPEYVNTIGENAFYNCSSLRKVTVMNPDPLTIELGENVFYGVPVGECTLYVPYGSKELYSEAPVWKEFGQIVEVRGRAQLKFSDLDKMVDASGYLYNIGTRKMVSMGEAYGTQSIVAAKGRVYKPKFTVSASLGGEIWVYFTDTNTDKVIFRTSSDSKVGKGVKACFGDGSFSANAQWKIDEVSPGIFTLQVPSNSSDYVADEYLGIDNSHASDAASPTNGIYWDVKGVGRKTQWAFITEEDAQEAATIDDVVAQLEKMLSLAKSKDIDVADEQAVYDNFESSTEQLRVALKSVREKLHFITFSDKNTQTICLSHWDTDEDGELTIEEAQAVTDLGETFRGATEMKYFEELKYFTGLTEIPANAFRSASALQTLYLPKNVKTIGDYAFNGCSVLRNLVILNDTDFIPYGMCSLMGQGTVFLPENMLSAYEADELWSTRIKRLTVFTGKPVITAEGSRIYGRNFASIVTTVSGAPVEGEPEVVCDIVKIPTAPVGEYPILLLQGTIVTPGVELQQGVFTITPAPLTITAKSYTRNVGEENPEFELTYKSFRNKETDTVFTQRPVVTCEATKDSPAGVYEIVVSGAEASNYEITYVNGTLTVVESLGITDCRNVADGKKQVYDLMGRKMNGNVKKGVYVIDRRKIVK
jgi:hypothetical protein